MNKLVQIGLSIGSSTVIPIIYNTFMNLSDGYYPQEYIDIVDALIIFGLMVSMIIQFYGTYLIIEKHGW